MQTVFREHTLTSQWPSAETFDYLLVVQPSAGVRASVMEEKYFFNGQYRQGAKDNMPPDIAVAGFTAREAMEDILIRWIGRMIGVQETFTVTLNNFSGVPDHAIFLRVQEQEPFRRLMAGMHPVSEFLTDNNCPPVQFYQHACMPLALGLSPAVYEKAMPCYARRSFYAVFQVQQLALIRRNKDGSFRQIQAFGLMPARNGQYAA